MGGLEASFPVRVGPGKSPLDVAEQFAFEKGFVQGRAVQLNIGTVSPASEIVDGAGNEFFSRTGFAENDDGRLALGGLCDYFENPLHSRRLADKPMKG